MVEVIKSSFIPKKEIQKVKRKAIFGAGVNIFFLVSLIVFLSSVVVAVGVFLWEKNLLNSIDEEKKVFKALEETNTIHTFSKIFDLNKKLKVSNELLNNHQYLIPIFNYLELKTIPTVYYTNMDLSVDGDIVDVTLQGVTLTPADLVKQKEEYLSGGPRFEDFMFLNINRDDKNRVTFDLNFKIKKRFLTKEKLY